MPAEGASRGMWWAAGWTVSGLVTLFLVVDGGAKVVRIAPVLDASQRLGLTSSMVVGIGAVLLACTLLYAMPRTAVLGAILLTGYLGGAVATHVRAGSSVFETVFPVGVGALAWCGLLLREPRLWTFLLRP
jgi:hypothetical protein